MKKKQSVGNVLCCELIFFFYLPDALGGFIEHSFGWKEMIRQFRRYLSLPTKVALPSRKMDDFDKKRELSLLLILTLFCAKDAKTENDSVDLTKEALAPKVMILIPETGFP